MNSMSLYSIMYIFGNMGTQLLCLYSLQNITLADNLQLYRHALVMSMAFHTIRLPPIDILLVPVVCYK